MGHLGNLKEEYRSLVRRLEGGPISFPEPRDPRAWEGWKEILEILYTPEEADLASKLPIEPTKLARLALRLKIPQEELKGRLDVMCDKGLVLDLVHPRTGRAKYLLAPPVVGFFEFSMMRAHDSIPKKQIAEALDKYTHGDDTFAREAFGGETVIGRALVQETGLGEDPVPDILDWQRATAIVENATSFAVALCYCRHKAEHLGTACDAPKEVCLSFNAGADFVARRKFGRRIEKAEAMAIMVAARERGLVQIADNVLNEPSYICNCCGCCCGQLQGINEFDLAAVNPSGFLARSDSQTCVGCSRCARACPIAAIAMTPRKIASSRRNGLLPVIDAERCIGCGVCTGACAKKAMSMVRAAERPYVPRNAIERSLRMAIERGHLSRLLYDEGGARGSRFLGKLLQALTSLPLAQRILANEQLKSRFLRAAMARIKDPTAG